MKKILIIEDEEIMIKQLEKDLDKKYSTIRIKNFTNIMTELRSETFDLVILDLHIINVDILAVASFIISSLKKPIIILTSNGELDSEIKYLKAGVVDYLIKPHNKEILNHKINNILNLQNGNAITYKDITIDYSKMEMNELKLTKNEFILLSYLLENSNQIIGFNKLIDKLWQNNAFVEKTALYRMLARSREKLNVVTKEVKIETIKGSGVILK